MEEQFEGRESGGAEVQEESEEPVIGGSLVNSLN